MAGHAAQRRGPRPPPGCYTIDELEGDDPTSAKENVENVMISALAFLAAGMGGTGR